MKKISLLLLAVASGMVVIAQNEPQLRTPMAEATRFGLKAGVNLATLEIDDDSNPNMNTNMKTGFNVGVFVNIPMGKCLHFQPEIQYSLQGTKAGRLNSNEPLLSGINDYDFHYFTVPLMLQCWTSNHGFFLELGPQFGYLSSANGDKENGTQVNLKDANFVKRTDFAGAAGLGYLSRVGLGVNARYVHGFTNVWDSDGSPNAARNVAYKNRVVQISLVYHFGAAK